jgi:nucleotide-binding universal stress UspA family protein
MYNKILVPLDGSQLTECSLEHTKSIASGCQVTEVILLRVVEPIESGDAATYAQIGYSPTEMENRRIEDAQKYVDTLAQRLNQEGINARGEAIVGRAAEAILDYSRKKGVDLIIMSTHGRSGISRWALGSVADRVSRHSTAPVLLVSPEGCRKAA